MGEQQQQQQQQRQQQQESQQWEAEKQQRSSRSLLDQFDALPADEQRVFAAEISRRLSQR